MNNLGFSVVFEPSGSGQTAHIQLDSPPGNRLGLGLLRALAQQIDELADRDDLRAVRLTAVGPDFCHGVNLRDPDLAQLMMSGDAGRIELAQLGHRLIDAWAKLNVPTIVAGRGWVIGAGACLFTASDFRYAAPGAQVRFPEVLHGMHLSWGILPRMVRVFGPSQARWMALAGEVVSVESLGQGDVVRVVDDPDRAAKTLAEQFAAQAPLAVRAVKGTLAHVDSLNAVAAQIDPQRFAETIGSDDFTEAVTAFLTKRPAVFKGA